MKCTDNIRARILPLFLAVTFVLTGCGARSLNQSYKNTVLHAGNPMQIADAFASSLCVAEGNVDLVNASVSGNACAGLFDVKNAETLYARNVYERIEPASLTKVMTAYVALKYGNLNQVMTATANVTITESGAQLIGVRKGDRMTLSQALHLLLIYSANDVALMIAENIAGSVNEFVTMMNNEALLIGATGSHFMNPHGLHADDHYVTAYDMYLIFNAALQYQEFIDIINMPVYATSYTDENGAVKEVDIKSTNAYLREPALLPDGVIMVGGKTGTTNAAGHCLIVQARNAEGNPFIAVVLRAEDNDTLYAQMTDLLSKITN